VLNHVDFLLAEVVLARIVFSSDLDLEGEALDTGHRELALPIK
jgi:hypothetical protein